jgi:hypothetical protein
MGRLNMDLVSVDPGKNEFAWAYFVDGKLIRCNIGGFDKSRKIFYQVGGLVSEAVIEVPQIYPQRVWKGDPNDLIDVALTAGRVSASFPKVQFVKPHAWKGNRPKSIDNDYTLSLLLQKELIVFNSCGVQKSKRHNVIDAIGIGLWKLGRR